MRSSANVLLSVIFLAIPSTFADACVLNGPRYQLASDTVHWSLELSDGETCLRGVRFNNVVVDKLMVVSAPQTGHVTLQGTGFSYKAMSDFQGRDFFSLMVSGATNKVPGSSTIEVDVSVSKAGESRRFSTSGPWNWSCTDSNGGTTASCSAPVASSAVNGSCGPANGVALSAAPSTGLCSLGTASAVTGSGPWHWSCAGSDNGTATSCGAPSTQTSGIMPADRLFSWNPGMMSKGGIPNRTTICAALSPSGGNDSAAIQAKLDSCPSNQVVMLNAGTFIVNNYLLIHSPITLRGSGAGLTILKKTDGARGRTSQVVRGTNSILTPVNPGSYTYDTQPIIIVGPSRWPGPDNSTSQNLTADGQQGAFSVTVANGSGFSAGQFVLLDELSGASWQPTPAGFPSAARVWRGDHVAWNIHNPLQPGDDPPAAMSWFSRTNRPTCEIKEIASVSGNTVTFTSPLSIGYRTSHTAQLTRYTAKGSPSAGNGIHVTNAGVENLTTIGGADGEIRFENAAYSWAKHVEVTQWIGEGIAIDGSFRVEVRDSYIHTGSWPEPGGGGYAISFAAGSSEALIENDISMDVNKVMVFRSSGAGSVVAYNYTDDGWIYGTEAWVEAGINASHMAGPHHVLFEGNYSFNSDSDYTHGNAIYLTFFRNWLSGQRRDFADGGNIRAIGLAYGSWWHSFIGNVLGRPGQMTGWTYTDSAMSCDANGNNCTGNNAHWGGSDIWRLGYDPERWSMNPDPQTLSTVVRDGNYDFLTNSQRWHNTPGGFAMPNSMYLDSKPAFFKTHQWPWIDPSTGTIYTLPAKARYDAGTPNSP
jgi:Pectate lyase superfamily protein